MVELGAGRADLAAVLAFCLDQDGRLLKDADHVELEYERPEERRIVIEQSLDTSPEGLLRARYESAAEGSLYRGLRALEKSRHERRREGALRPVRRPGSPIRAGR